ncbi:hypothetical protein BC833DRAFT_647147 [Globomyces pollinis-pini]|nr:hypothetical protein BC833DRAFT_647147 [Globomyces pollinis-pini]
MDDSKTEVKLSMLNFNTKMTKNPFKSESNQDDVYGRLIKIGSPKCQKHHQEHVIYIPKRTTPNGLIPVEPPIFMPKSVLKLKSTFKMTCQKLFQTIKKVNRAQKNSIQIQSIKPQEIKSKLEPIQGSYYWNTSPSTGHDLIQFKNHPDKLNFRLICDRDSLQVQIFAGTLSKTKLKCVDKVKKWVTTEGCVDSFSKSPVLVLLPGKAWVQLSMLGLGHIFDDTVQKEFTRPGPLVRTFSNTLVDGTLIYSNGHMYLWKSNRTCISPFTNNEPIDQPSDSHDGNDTVEIFETNLNRGDTARVIDDNMNELIKQDLPLSIPIETRESLMTIEIKNMMKDIICPITLDEIPCDDITTIPCHCRTTWWQQFVFPKKPVSRRVKKQACINENRPWFFTGCGHTFSYHSPIQNFTTCPICRTKGDYQPLLLDTNQDILEHVPDSVIVPCGHMIAAVDCARWCGIGKPDGDGDGVCIGDSVCPFCGLEID